ncbi:MAG: hypothetical protein ACK4UJ_06485, partial [Leptonema sp. (in: bacteria)]
GPPSSSGYWTGLVGTTWLTNPNNCLGWSNGTSLVQGQGGVGGSNTSYSIDSTFPETCDTSKRLLCIQQ